MRALLAAFVIPLLASCQPIFVALTALTDPPSPPSWGYRYALGRVDAGGFFPAGHLFFLPRTAYSLDDSSRNGWLILELDTPTQGSARSYVKRLSADCKSGVIATAYVLTFDGPGGSGRERTRQLLTPAKVLGPPDSAGRLALSALCRTSDFNEFNCRVYGQC